MFNNFSFKNCAIYEIMWKNTVELCRPQMTKWCMHNACWVPETTNTHSGYVILIAFHGNNGFTNAPQCYIVVHCLSCLI